MDLLYYFILISLVKIFKKFCLFKFVHYIYIQHNNNLNNIFDNNYYSK